MDGMKGKQTHRTGFIKGEMEGCLKVCLKCRISQKCVSQNKRRARKNWHIYYQHGVFLSRKTAKVMCDKYQKETNMHKPWRMLWLYQNRSCRPSLLVTKRRYTTVCMLYMLKFLFMALFQSYTTKVLWQRKLLHLNPSRHRWASRRYEVDKAILV